MLTGVLVKVKGQQLTLAPSDGCEQVTIDVPPGVAVKLDGQTVALADLREGDRVECHAHFPDETLAVLKVCRNVADGCEASTADGSTDGTDAFKRAQPAEEAQA